MGSKLERVYDQAFSKSCFKELYTTHDFHEVGGLGKDHVVTQPSTAHRERLLLKMTIIQRMFQRFSDNRDRYGCPTLWKICDSLLTDFNLLEDLMGCLGSSDQLVAFSACKSLARVLIGFPLSPAKAELFQNQLFINLDEVQTGEQPWRLLYTMELLRQIVKFCQSSQDAIPQHTGKEVPACNCSSLHHQQVSKVTLINMCLAHKWMNILPLYVPFWNDLLNVFNQDRDTFALGNNQLIFYSDISAYVHEKGLSSNEWDENTMVSFFMFFLEVMKYSQKIENQEHEISLENRNCGDTSEADQQRQRVSIISDEVKPQQHEQRELHNPNNSKPLLKAEMHALLERLPVLLLLLHLPSLPAMSFKSLLHVLSQLFVPSQTFSTYRNLPTSQKLKLPVLQSSAVFVTGISCCFMENIPWCSGLVGFGGTQAKRFLDGENVNRADPVALRRLSLLVLKAAFVLLEDGAHDYGSIVLDTIMCWSCNLKLLVHGAVSSEGIPRTAAYQCNREEDMFCDLLFDLFSDQDDDLMETLLLLLKIYQKVYSLTNKQHDQHWSSVTCQFNPHALFVSLLNFISFDHSVLLDFLISPETCFLSYLLSYLRFILGNWKLFCMGVEHYGEIHHCILGKLSREQSWAFEDSLEGKDTQGSPVLNSRLALNSEGKESKATDLRKELKSVLPKEKSNILTDPVIKQCGLAKCEDKVDGLQSIARVYLSEESSSEESEEDVLFMETDPSAFIPDIGHCEEKNIEEADMNTATTGLILDQEMLASVEEESHFFDHFDGNDTEKRTNIQDLSSHSECKKLFLEDAIEVVSPLNNASALTETETETGVSQGVTPDVMGSVMSVLIRLRLSVERLQEGGLFPYSAEPLLRLMRRVEELYDGC